MKLLDGDRDTDPREHAVHDRGRKGQCEPADSGDAQQDLQKAGRAGDSGRRGPAVLADESGDDNGEAGGGTADLQGGTAERTGDDAADDRGDEPRDQRGPEAAAIPRERGIAIRKTTSDAGRS